MLAYLAIYTISRNNKISELKAPKIVVNGEAKLLGSVDKKYEKREKDGSLA